MNSPRSPAYKTAMEELAKLLQDTGNSIERMLSSLSAASVQPLGSKLLNMRTSLSIGITPSTLNNRGDNSHSTTRNLMHKEDALASASGPDHFRTAASTAAHHQAHLDKAGQGHMLFGLNALAGNGDQFSSSDENSLKLFLEEIKKTICNWSARQKVLVQDKSGSERSVAHAGTLVSLPNGAPLSLGFNKEQSPSVNTKAMGSQGMKDVHVLLCPAKESAQSFLKRETEKPSLLEKVVDDIANQLLESDDEDSHINDHEQTPPVIAQNPSEKGKAAQMPPVADVGGEQGSTSQAANLATEGNATGTHTPDEANPTTDSFITPTKTDQVEKLPLIKWRPPTSAAKNNDKTLSFPRAVEIISSPDWLPEGWITELKTRTSGNSAGSKDKYYVDPVSNRRFRSRKEVVAYLERGKPKLNDSPPASPIKKLLGPEPLPSVPKKCHKKAKAKESSTPSSSALPPPMVPSIASPRLSGNMFVPPFRTGQPSEWLLYESLAGLPFPMFDPFYYADMGGNKSSSSKSSHIPTRPWFFSGPETSWSPFMDRSKSRDKGRDYHSYFSMLPYPSDAAPKSSSAGGGKKPIKRKSTDS